MEFPRAHQAAYLWSRLRGWCAGLLLGLAVDDPRAAAVEHLFDLPGNFHSPSDVALSPQGTAHVVDGLNHCVKSFDARGRLLATVGRKGSGPAQFDSPLGVAVGASGKIYVADTGNHRIQIFDPSGQFIHKIDLPDRQGRPADPTDLAVDEANNAVFVVDNDNHRLLQLDLATMKLKQIHGAPGSRKREFHYPFTIARTSLGDLCVVEVLNTRVQVLNAEGLFVAFIGDWGVDKGQFYRPKGIAIDGQDRLFVSDSYLGVVQIFDQTGRFLEVVNDPATGKVKKFETPMGLAIDAQQRLYVVEMSLNRVGVFRLLKTPPP